MFRTAKWKGPQCVEKRSDKTGMSKTSDVDSDAVHCPVSIGTAACFVQHNGRARNASRKGVTKRVYISDSGCNVGPGTRTTSTTSAMSHVQHDPTFSMGLGLYTHQRSVNVIGDMACATPRERVWTRAPVNTNGLGTCSNVEMCLNVSARYQV